MTQAGSDWPVVGYLFEVTFRRAAPLPSTARLWAHGSSEACAEAMDVLGMTGHVEGQVLSCRVLQVEDRGGWSVFGCSRCGYDFTSGPAEAVAQVESSHDPEAVCDRCRVPSGWVLLPIRRWMEQFGAISEPINVDATSPPAGTR